MIVFCKQLFDICLMAFFMAFPALAASGTAGAVDYWAAANDAGVVTNNDCGAVSAIHGEPVIRRSFLAADDAGIPANIADRVNTGDEIVVPSGSRLEMISGSNIILVFGPGSRVRMGGLRNFVNAGGAPVVRLDLAALEGEMRLQVRLNEQKPMAALIRLDDAEVLVRRGDVEIARQGGWRAAALSGSAMARLVRSGVPGAPFAVAERRAVGSGGDEELQENEMLAIKTRIPFSFETRSAALPPLPHASTVLEAP